MKIVYCIAGMYKAGGMERVLANKANYWARHGHVVVIITTEQKGREPIFKLDEGIECFDLEVNYEENNGKSFWNKLLHYPYKRWKHQLCLAALLKELNADVTVSMFCHDAAFITKMNDGSRKVLEVHFSRFKRLQYGRKGLWRLADVWRSRTDEKIVRTFDRFVVLTREDKAYWGNLHNMEIIPNAITALPPKSAALQNKKVIAVGRYTHQKGFDYLIDSWVFVHRMQPQWELDIVGDGEWRDFLQRKITDSQLQDVVHLIPSINNMEEVYSKASILVMSSRYEGLPMVLLEGASFGLPMVAFACKCGPADVITHGLNGFLIPQPDVELLADKIILLIESEDMRIKMGNAAREKAACFTEEKIMRRWEKLFQQLIKKEE